MLVDSCTTALILIDSDDFKTIASHWNDLLIFQLIHIHDEMSLMCITEINLNILHVNNEIIVSTCPIKIRQ